MKFLVTKINYRTPGGRLVVDVYGRSEDGKRVHKILKGTRPYFYSRDPPPKRSNLVTGVVKEGHDIFGNELYKIYTRFPFDVTKVREWFSNDRHYEANVTYENRVKIDYKCFGVIETPSSKIISVEQIEQVTGTGIKPRYSHVDIEVDAKTADPNKPKGEVNCVTMFDSHAMAMLTISVGRCDKEKILKILDEILLEMVNGDQEKFEKYRFKIPLNIIEVKTEEELFVKMNNYFEKYQPDIFTAWNVDFDFNYLINRAKQEKYPLDLRNVEKFDMMKGYSRLHEGENRESLEWCSNEDFGFGKIQYEGALKDLYRKDRDRFVAYNIWDAYLSEMLNKKRNILGFHLTLSNISSCLLHKSIYNSRIIDSMMLHFVKNIMKLDVALPTHPTRSGKMDQGGYVHEPAKGVYRRLIVFDLKSEYPSAIRSMNLSPETRWRGADPPDDPENYHKTPRGNYYDKRKQGVLPTMIAYLMDTRDEMKGERNQYKFGELKYDMFNDMQRAFKEMTNSAFGVMEFSDFRLRDSEVASDITAFARENIKWIMEIAGSMGYIVIYSDTDSVFLLSKIISEEFPDEHVALPLILKEGFALLQKINDSSVDFGKKFGLYDLQVLLQFEKIYDPWFQTYRETVVKGVVEKKGKKRYVGRLMWKEGKNLLDEPLDTRKEVKGFEVKRINIAPYAKKIQHKVFDLILTFTPPEDVGKFIRGIHKAIIEGKIPPEMMAIPAKVNQENYSPMPAFIRAVHYTKDVLGIDMTDVGSDFIWCYGHIKGKPISHAKNIGDCAVAIPAGSKFPDDFEINVQKMVDRTIKGPLSTIVDGIGLGDIDELLSPYKTQKLEAFI